MLAQNVRNSNVIDYMHAKIQNSAKFGKIRQNYRNLHMSVKPEKTAKTPAASSSRAD